MSKSAFRSHAAIPAAGTRTAKYMVDKRVPRHDTALVNTVLFSAVLTGVLLGK